MDPMCFDQPAGKEVCAGCFSKEADLASWITENGDHGDCFYCESEALTVIDTAELCDFIRERIATFYTPAGDQLPYDGREGGYQGWHTDTNDLIFGTIGLDLGDMHGSELEEDILDYVGDETWSEFDWLCLEYNQSLKSSYAQFAYAISHERRFFFLRHGETGSSHPDERSVGEFLWELGALIDRLGLIKELPWGTKLYRARPWEDGKPHKLPIDLGPPPKEHALQSNRMNPPGIPMFYGAETLNLALAETKSDTACSIGCFVTKQSVKVIDLAYLPKVPGFFSNCSREDRLGLSFLHDLGKIIAAPVERDERVHVDYIPTQVIAEFFQNYEFENGPIKGVRYQSATEISGVNTCLFINHTHIQDCVEPTEFFQPPSPILELTSVNQVAPD